MAEESTLYDRIGGEQTINRLVGNFYERVIRDEELGPFFVHVEMEKLQRMQFEFFSAALGGPIKYTGRPLNHVHHGRGIKPAHMQRFVELLLETLKVFNLEDEDVNQIISRVNTYSDDIIGGTSEDG